MVGTKKSGSVDDIIFADVNDTEKNTPPIHVEENAAPQGIHYLHVDLRLEKRVVRKLDWNIMPIVIALCMLRISFWISCFSVYYSSLTLSTDLCSILDRGNIGNAQIAGMSTSLKMSDGQYQWLLTIFYIPYIIFELGALMVRHLSPDNSSISLLPCRLVEDLAAAYLGIWHCPYMVSFLSCFIYTGQNLTLNEGESRLPFKRLRSTGVA
jgi:hypothetical protein